MQCNGVHSSVYTPYVYIVVCLCSESYDREAWDAQQMA